DVTSQGDFGSVVETTIAKITRNNWFLRQKENLHSTVRVLMLMLSQATSLVLTSLSESESPTP
ncbi:MAG: hypothetical protein ABL949_16360, partial [Fimbriimonadaceae bacterium]